MNEIISTSDIYWITRLDGINAVASVAAVVGGIASAALLVCGCGMRGATRTDYSKRDWPEVPDEQARAIGVQMHWHLRWVLPLALLGIAGALLIPTTRQAIAIVVIPKIANNEDVQGLGSDLIGVAREWLDEMRPRKEKR